MGELAEPLDERAVEILEKARVVLGKIALGDRHAPAEVALVGVELAHQNAEQRGRARLVVAHKGDLVALFDGEGHVVEHLDAVDGLADAIHEEDVLAGLALGLKAHEGVLAAGGGHLLQLDGIEHLFAAGGLTALGLVGAEAADELLQIPDLFLALLVLVADELLHERGGLVPEIVVAGVHLAGFVIDVHDVGAHGVKEVAVMADHNHDGVAVHQEVLQPFGAFHVQAVGGLVQQNDVGMAKQRLRQQHLHLLAAVEAGHLGVVQLGGDADAVEELGGLGFGIPAVHLGKLALQLRRALAVGVAEVGLGVERVLFLHDVVEAAVAHDDGVHHGEGVVLEVVLLQHAHAVLLAHGHAARGGRKLAGDDAQQRGFARAVGADDAVAVVGLEDEVYVLVEQIAGKLEGDVGEGQHLAFVSFACSCSQIWSLSWLMLPQPMVSTRSPGCQWARR